MKTQERPPLITVCTATYNRAGLLPRVYESLRLQTFRDFEWIIVDDGSKDETKELVESWIDSGDFPIRYIWKDNGGQYSAMNVGVREASGHYFASLDSDDRYVPDALERFMALWEGIPSSERERFAGVCGLDAYESGEIVGTRFPHDILDSDDIEIRMKFRVEGDKISLMRTKVMKEFPFPEECGRFINPGVVWNRIGLKYKTRFVNQVFAIIEYQPDGLTASDRFNYFRNPESVALCLRDLINSGRRFPLVVTIKTYANYVRYSLHQGTKVREQAKLVNPVVQYWFFVPLGFFLFWRDRKLIRAVEANA